MTDGVDMPLGHIAGYQYLDIPQLHDNHDATTFKYHQMTRQILKNEELAQWEEQNPSHKYVSSTSHQHCKSDR